MRGKRGLVFFLSVLTCLSLSARQVDTFYGPLEVQEPVLLELIDSPAFQRLKDVYQYGVAHYTTHKEAYNRYDHSLGVFTILRAKGCCLEEQIAGLLHDVSHTAFSHVGDWVFGKEDEDEDYQNTIHANFLEQSGLGAILKAYGLTIEQVLPVEELCPALEGPLPDLCADRIDYNIQGAYHQGFITHEEALTIFQDLSFVDHRWVSRVPELMKKLVLFSLCMTQSCWGGPANYLSSRWLADAIIRAVDLGDLTYAEFQFGIDEVIWHKLLHHEDPVIRKNMKKVLHSRDFFSFVDSEHEADLVVRSRFRGIDPWVLVGESPVRLTETDEELRLEFTKTKLMMKQGWMVRRLPTED